MIRAIGARRCLPSRRRIRRGTTPDTDREARDTEASASLRRESARARELEHLRQTAGFRLRGRCAHRREAIVTAPLVVVLRRRTLPYFADQALLEQSLDRPIQRARAEFQRAAGPLGDVLHDRVAVAVPVSQRDEDVERGWLKGK